MEHSGAIKPEISNESLPSSSVPDAAANDQKRRRLVQ